MIPTEKEEQDRVKEMNNMWLWQMTNIISRSYDSYSIDKQLSVQVVAANTLEDNLPHGTETIFSEVNNQYSIQTMPIKSSSIGFTVSLEKWTFDQKNKNNPIFNVVLTEIGRELATRRNRIFLQALCSTAGNKVEDKKGELDKAILTAINTIKKAGFSPDTVIISSNQESGLKKIKKESQDSDALDKLAVHILPILENQVLVFDKNEILMASTILQVSFKDLLETEPKLLIIKQEIKCSSINSGALVKITCSSV